MMVQKTLFLFLFLFQSLSAVSVEEQFKQVGYVEICDKRHGSDSYETLYAYFDDLIDFLQSNPFWEQKLYGAKERFIRSKDRNKYSSDFFGFYDESERKGRSQIAFYYSTHFHNFIVSNYPEFNQVPEVIRFFEACRDIQQAYGKLFDETAAEIGLTQTLNILFKVIKYLPEYLATKPHYDGTAFSLFLDSTDNQSLLLTSYKYSFTVDDFSSPLREFSRSKNQNTILLIPGTLLTEFSIYPTPHIVKASGNVRYATIAFAMRPNYFPKKNEFTLLPNFKIN